MKRFFQIIVPGIMSVVIFGAAIFLYVLPVTEDIIMTKKRETPRELVRTVIELLSSYEKQVREGSLELAEAQTRALGRVGALRYGPDKKDYFWINSVDAKLIMHPYRPDLTGKRLPDIKDIHGEDLLVAANREALEPGGGFIEYNWQWKDDPTKIASKVSYVSWFEPWGWVIGSGIYYDDVRKEISGLTRNMVLTCIGVLFLVGLLSAYLTFAHLSVARQRKAAVEALRLSEEKFRGISTSALDGIVMMNSEGRISFWNAAAANIFGYAAQEVTGRDLHELLALPEDVGRFKEEKERFFQEGIGSVVGKMMELTAVRKGGELIPIELSVSALHLGDKWHAVGVIRDISDRKRMETEKRRNETLISTAIEQLPAGILIVESKGRRMLHANATAIAMLGDIGPDYLDMIEGVEDKRRIKLFDANGRKIEPSEYPLNKAASHGIVTANTRFILQKADGERIWIELSAAPVKDEMGETIFGVVVFSDISDRIRAEREMIQLEHQLLQARKMEAIGTLAGGIAHDFNNILMAILGNTELAEIRHEAGEDISGALNEAKAAGLRARDLVQQILDFSGRTVRKREPVLMADALAETMKLLKTTIPSQIEVRVDVETDRTMVLADPTNIYRIITNLCTNAVQAMGNNRGELDVSVRTVDIGLAMPRYRDLMPGRYLVLTVKDTGQGIAPENLDRIFEPYFTTKRVGEGSGMGLSMVDNMVREIGGTIYVDSVPEKGTSFTVLFPVHRGDTPPSDDAKIYQISKGSGHILIVDNEVGVTTACRNMLSQIGYLVTVVNDAPQALEVFSKNPDAFDLIITDLTMHRMAGIELARRIKAVRSETPIVLWTRFINQLNKANYKAYGFDYLMMKPPELRNLTSVLSVALNSGEEKSEVAAGLRS